MELGIIGKVFVSSIKQSDKLFVSSIKIKKKEIATTT